MTQFMTGQNSKKIIWSIFTGIALISILIGFYIYNSQYRKIRSEKYNEIKAIAHLKGSQIQEWREERIGDTRILANDDYLFRLIQNIRSNPEDSDSLRLIQNRLELIKSQYSYDDVLIVDGNGNLIFSVAEVQEQTPENVLPSIIEAIARNDVVFSDMYRCETCGKIHLDVIAPFQNSTSNDPILVIARVNPSAFLYPLIQSWPTPSESAETLLVRREGNDVVFINELRFRQNSALNFRYPVSDTKLPAAQAVLGKTGEFLGVDYRGTPVLADLSHIEGTDWYMVSKVDQAEVFSELYLRTIMGIIVQILLLGFLAAAIALIYNRAQRHLLHDRLEAEQAKLHAQELFRTTLYSIGDAVITTDRSGVVRHMNPVAESLTGWSEVEAEDHHISEIFHIKNEQTGNIVENPVERVIREGIVVGLANHTILTSRDGREFPISDSGAPIANETGDILGVVLVFKDMTEDHHLRQSLETSEERFRLLFQNIPDAFFSAKIITNADGKPVDYKYISVNQQFEDQFNLHIKQNNGDVASVSTPDFVNLWLPIFSTLSEKQKATAFEATIPSIDKTMDVKAFNTKPGEFGVIFRDLTERIIQEESLRESESRYRAKTEELEGITRFSEDLRKAQTMEEMLPLLAKHSTRALNGDSCLISLLDPSGATFHMEYVDNFLRANQGTEFSIQQGVSGRVLRTREAVKVNNYQDDPDHVQTLTDVSKFGPAVFAPIQSTTELLGVLCIARENRPDTLPFSDHDLQILTTYAEIAGNAIHRANLFIDVQHQLENLQALHSIDLAISGSIDMNTVLGVIATELLKNLKVDATCIQLVNQHTLQLEPIIMKGLPIKKSDYPRYRIGEGLPGQVAIKKVAVEYYDLSQEEDPGIHPIFTTKEGYKAYFAVPLVAKGDCVGVMEVFNQLPIKRSQIWRDFLITLAGQAAIAIDDLRLFNDLAQSNLKLRLSYDATIEGWSKAMDMRDRETEGHSERVTEIALRLAERLGINGESLEHIHRGALLHDIGKLGVPDSILLKPGPLTVDERAIIENHPILAYRLLAPIEYLKSALDIPHYHHEKWDGTGYPDKLRGEQIPLAARIFSVSDVWDALTNERPYRSAWSKEKAIRYIYQESGKSFDPKVVEQFIQLPEIQAHFGGDISAILAQGEVTE